MTTTATAVRRLPATGTPNWNVRPTAISAPRDRASERNAIRARSATAM
jgi:hypothetical protein